ncbi:MAG: response regulator transcription factor [Verrucomicrobia bacterium]|nr:response regulator transcription factor [Verrucomicrobiota bacterium]
MKILVIEDSVRLQASIGMALRKSGYVVDAATDGEEGLWLAEAGLHDVVVLDLMLPKLDGLTLLRRLRDKGVETHVLILTAKDAVEDRVAGLEAGADDYLTKPFSLDELLARVGALVRRRYGQKNPELRIGNLLLDLNRHEVRVEENPLSLTPREYRVLEFLCLRAGALASRPEIEAHMYAEASEIFSNTIDSTVSVLRRKLAASGSKTKILTKRGEGYLLEECSE